MKLSKEFIKILANKKHGWVGHIIKDMNVLEFDKKNVIQNLDKKYKIIEQIYYTVDFLQRNNLITVDQYNYENGIPTFNPIEFWNKNGPEDKYLNDRMTFIDDLNKSYWGKDISILPSFYDFVDNGFLTDKQIQDRRNIWIPVLVAVFSSALTVFLSAKFNQNNIMFLIK